VGGGACARGNIPSVGVQEWRGNAHRDNAMIGVDFFCGAGGLTKGLVSAGIEVVVGIDSNLECRRTFESNNRGVRFHSRDLALMEISELDAYLDHGDTAPLLFACCTPCQPFTKLNTTAGAVDNARLLREFGRFIRAMKPRYVLFENVPGIAKVPGRSTFRRFLALLGQLGYATALGILDAKDYGVAQTRHRLVLLATLGGIPSLPPPSHGPGRVPHRTVAEAISHFPPIAAGEMHPTVPNHWAAALSPLNRERISHTPQDGGDRRSWPKRLWLDCHRNGHRGHTDVYGRMWWGRPSPSITCRCDSLSNGRFGHPEQNRAISLREAAALQGFPDEYLFFGASKASIAAQIGNAVPVPLARALGQHILMLEEARASGL